MTIVVSGVWVWFVAAFIEIGIFVVAHLAPLSVSFSAVAEDG